MHNHTYGMVVRDIRAAYDELCQRDARKEINVLVEVYTLIHPMHYFNRHLPACAGKELHFVLTRSEADWVLVYK
ncbi:hypothetical protein, partial [Pseudomonas sp. MPR-AND1A]|uniref:hypothetical protein n=1 Tax=Pseudomonas sp. MPR-AND1A TaxID=2070600 RepID=UPI0011AF83EC